MIIYSFFVFSHHIRSIIHRSRNNARFELWYSNNYRITDDRSDDDETISVLFESVLNHFFVVNITH